MKKRIAITLLAFVTAIVSTGLSLATEEMPEQITIDGISRYFEAVEFDHAMHTELGEDCSVCHHHTTGTGTADKRCLRCHADDDGTASVGCRTCHVADPFSAERIHQEAADRYQYHIDKPGLKAAYHWNCLGCHERMDGPTDCRDCHARTPEGDVLYQADARRSESAAGQH